MLQYRIGEVRLFRKTTSLSGVAHRSRRFRFDKQRVIITICNNGNNMKNIAGCFPFFPETLLRPAPKNNLPIVERSLHRFTVHTSDHEDSPVTNILNNGRDESVEFVEI